MAVVNTDVVVQLISRTCSKSTEINRIDEALTNLVRQRSLYPLYPAHDSVPLDLSQLERLEMQRVPDILITPSKLMRFAKVFELM